MSVKEYNQTSGHSYSPTAHERGALNLLYDRLYRMQYVRNRRYRYFNDRGLLRYLDDSVKRWNGYIPPRDDLAMDWQANYFNNFTRNVVIGFLSNVNAQSPGYRVRARDEENRPDAGRARVCEGFLKWGDQINNSWYQNLLIGLEAVTKGTAIVDVLPRRVKRKVKEITKYDPLTGEVDWKEKEVVLENDVFYSPVPLEEMYFGNVWQPEIQMQPDICRKYRVRYSEAEWSFSKYKNWKAVQPGAFFIVSGQEQIPYFKERDYADIDYDIVEIVDYQNRNADRRILAANGVILYDGPIPFHHKMYSYAKCVFEPLAIDFFYGKSLPDKIASDQDIINILWNMMLDAGFLSVYKPILTDDPDADENDGSGNILVPGLNKKVGDKDRYRVMNELTGPDASHFQLLQLALKFASDNSGPVAGGGRLSTPQGGAITANQALLAQEQARQVLGLNGRFIEKLHKDRAELMLRTQLQFYSLDARLMETKGKADAAALFKGRVVRVNDAELSDGTRGTLQVSVLPERALPTQDELDLEREVLELGGERSEIIAITPEYVRNIQFDVEIIPESTYQQSKSLERALGMEFVKGRLALFPQSSNMSELARFWDELFDQDTERMSMVAPPPPLEFGAGQPGLLPQGFPSGLPQPPLTSGEVSAQVAGVGRPLSLEQLVGQRV